MSDTGKIVVCILSSLTFCAGAKAIVADTSANPYQGIVDRNVFGLKPPTPVNKDTTKDNPPPPKITLTGITTIFHDKRALMNVAMPAKPSEPAKNQSFILAEHQREGDIEVLEIDVKTGDVKVSNFGTVVTLNLEKDGAKLPNTPALPIAGAQPNPGGYVPPGQAPAMKPIPTRQLRLPESGGAAAPSAGNLASATPQNYGGSPGFGGPPGFASAQSQNGPPSISPDEQAMQMLAQHVQHTDQGFAMPPLPPPLADALEGPAQQPTPTPIPQNVPSPFPPHSSGLPSFPQ